MTVSIGSGRVGLGPSFSSCSELVWVGSVSWWVGLDRVTQNGPMYNSAHPDLRDPPLKQPAPLARDLRALKAPSWVQVRMFDTREDDLDWYRHIDYSSAKMQRVPVRILVRHDTRCHTRGKWRRRDCGHDTIAILWVWHDTVRWDKWRRFIVFSR